VRLPDICLSLQTVIDVDCFERRPVGQLGKAMQQRSTSGAESA